MKSLIRKWLGICVHECWTVVVLMTCEGAELLAEKCAACHKIQLYRL